LHPVLAAAHSCSILQFQIWWRQAALRGYAAMVLRGRFNSLLFPWGLVPSYLTLAMIP
jgi:hypothetical protein